MNGNSTVRVGVIGLGNIGRLHADHLETLSSSLDVELAGGMDVDPTARDRFAETYAVPAHDDHEELLDAVDAAIVTTPNRFHEEYALAAFEAGVDVLVEKPLAHTLESAERIAAAAAEADSICMVGFHNRFARPVQVLKGYAADGRFGDLHHVEAGYVRRRGIPARGTWFTDTAVAGGGALIDIGAHAIDLALYLLDFPAVREVSGVTRATFGGRDDYTYLEMWGEDGDGPFDVEDSATAFVRCAGDRTVSLEVAWAANRPPDHEFVLRGSEAGASFDRGSGEVTVFETGSTGAAHFSDAEITTDPGTPHLEEQRRFVEACASGEDPGTNTVEQALVVQRVMDAIYRSSDRGEAVTPDRGLPTDR